tara:strand:+ start:294 stop:695 length:402 start_codon:yes stop_codon:yes gene_type:complete
MISKEVVARDTIRMLLSEIKKYEIDERKEATDPIILALINKNVKQRRDSIEQFKNGGRADLVTKEEEQLKVILQYLPQQLSVDEIKAIVQQGIDEISAQTMQDMGKLMALLKPQLEGKADMSVVSAAVKELLN